MADDPWSRLAEANIWDWSGRFRILGQLLAQSTGQARRDAQYHYAEALCRSGEWDAGREVVDAMAAGLTAAPGPPASFLRHFIGLAEMAGRTGIALAALRMAEAQRSASGTTEDAEAFAGLRARLERAEAIRAELAGSTTAFIPIGMECLPYNLLMRWGFAEHAVEGPYTAAIAPEEGVSRAIADGFAQFRDPAAYRSIRTPSGHDSPRLPPYGMLMAHESGPYFCEDGFARVAALYARRAERLLAAARGGRAVFVLERYPPTDLGRIEAAIATAFPALGFRIAAIDYTGRGAGPGQPRLRAVPVRKPGPEYVWHTHLAFNTAAGLGFEQPMAEMILGCARELA